MSQVTVNVPATTANLGPGFDCVGLALDFGNTLTAEVAAPGVWSVTVQGLGAGELPVDQSSLAIQAMQRLFAEVGDAPRGVMLTQDNRVPLCSGLGSSSTAIVGGLVAANALCGSPFGERRLVELATELEGHPDNVAPALLGGLVVVAAAGGELAYVRFDAPTDLQAVVAMPDLRLSTAEARRALPDTYPKADAIFNVTRAALLVAALVAGDHEALRVALQDRIHQPYRLPLMQGAADVLDAARQAGALGAVVSGAGPTLLALCDGGTAAVAAAMVEAWAKAGVQAEAKVVGLSNVGATASA